MVEDDCYDLDSISSSAAHLAMNESNNRANDIDETDQEKQASQQRLYGLDEQQLHNSSSRTMSTSSTTAQVLAQASQTQAFASCESSSCNQLSRTSSYYQSSYISFILKWWFAIIVSSLLPAIDLCDIIYSAIHPHLNPVAGSRTHRQENGHPDTSCGTTRTDLADDRDEDRAASTDAAFMTNPSDRESNSESNFLPSLIAQLEKNTLAFGSALNNNNDDDDVDDTKLLAAATDATTSASATASTDNIFGANKSVLSNGSGITQRISNRRSLLNSPNSLHSSGKSIQSSNAKNIGKNPFSSNHSSKSLLSSGRSLRMSNHSFTSHNGSFVSRASSGAGQIDDFGNVADDATTSTVASLATKSELANIGNMEEYRKKLSAMYLRSEGRLLSSQSAMNATVHDDDSLGKSPKEQNQQLDKSNNTFDDDDDDVESYTKHQSSSKKKGKKSRRGTVIIEETLSESLEEEADSKKKGKSKKSRRGTVIIDETLSESMEEAKTLLERQQQYPWKQIARKNPDETMNIKRIDLDDSSEEGRMSQISIESEAGGVGLRFDVFTYVMISKPMHTAWVIGLATFILQMILVGLYLASRLGLSTGTSILKIPFNVTSPVRGTQIFLISIATLLSSYDLFKLIKELKMLWLNQKNEWSRVTSTYNGEDGKTDEEEQHPLVYLVTDENDPNDEDAKNNEGDLQPDQPTVHHEDDKRIWLQHIVVPNLLRFMLAVVVANMTFLVIIQGKAIAELVLHFFIIQTLGRLHHIAFCLTRCGYLGSNLKNITVAASKIRVADKTSPKFFTIPLVIIVFVTVAISTACVYGTIISGQLSGAILKMYYPKCQENEPDKISKIADGICHGGRQNTIQCGFDGGDCTKFNTYYPNCKIENPWQIGNGHCEEEHNIEECGFDGHDCCPIKDVDQYLGDGHCSAGFYFSNACKYDKGDCDEFRKKFPLCPELWIQPKYTVDDSPAILGDGICDFIPEYMTVECGYEYGDCENCQVKDPKDIVRLGDGICDGGIFNTAECGWDGGDCIECNVRVDDFSKIGDGTCDGGKYLTKACNFDGLDCQDCKVEDTKLIGNGVCDHGEYNTIECGWDGEDCECMNNAFNGVCEQNPSKMIELGCIEACLIRPLLTETTVQLQSRNKESHCLTQIGDNDKVIELVLGKCDGSDGSNADQQSFYFDKTNGYSGLIRSAAHDTTKSCLQMLKMVLNLEDKILMHPQCTDTWEVLETGALKNIKHEMCLGRVADSLHIVPVDCNSDLVETWGANDNRHNLFKLIFETETDIVGNPIRPQSSGPFEIEGYGIVPSVCHNSSGATCQIDIYGYNINTLILVTKTANPWKFTIRGDVTELITYDTELGGMHIKPFPTLLGLGQFDRQQTYGLAVQSKCFDVVFKTVVPSAAKEDNGSFQIDGYGSMPSSCHSVKEAVCSITICGRRTLVLKAYTLETWQFSLTGDVDALREYKTVPGGTHKEFSTMDAVKHDFLHVYDLKKTKLGMDKGNNEEDENPTMSPSSQAIVGADDRSNDDGQKSATLISPSDQEKYIQFQSQSNPFMCLNSSESNPTNNAANIFYNKCDSENRFFTMKNKDESSFELRTSRNECAIIKASLEEAFSSPLINVALNKPTIQSSTFNKAVSSKAVDGDISGSFFDGSITHTEISSDPHWTVHLQSPYLIERISVFNRDDPCCRSRLNDFKLSILLDKVEVWSYIHSGEPKYKTTIIPTLNGIVGDEVKVMLFGEKRILSLAQVEVYSRISDYNPQHSLRTPCTESWKMLQNGAMKNVNSSKCLGTGLGSTSPILVECDSQLAETWTYQIDKYQSYKILFKTSSEASLYPSPHHQGSPHSSGPFEIEGYGLLPSNCHNAPGAECEIDIYGMNAISIKARTADNWEFTISGDIGPLISFNTATRGTHKAPFPTMMALDGYDTQQTYVLTKNNSVP